MGHTNYTDFFIIIFKCNPPLHTQCVYRQIRTTLYTRILLYHASAAVLHGPIIYITYNIYIIHQPRCVRAKLNNTSHMRIISSLVLGRLHSAGVTRSHARTHVRTGYLCIIRTQECCIHVYYNITFVYRYYIHSAYVQTTTIV